GFLARTNATAPIQQAYTGSFIPRLNREEVARLIGSGVVLIDARAPRDFQDGHLDGAINIPVNTPDARRRDALGPIAKDSRIVLYCQSAGCKFAETVAIKLITDGFSNIALFQGGWQEWQTHSTQTGK
ncbi:MAG: rhodanese-like domain-containing protein, partial [Bacillota bacterium]